MICNPHQILDDLLTQEEMGRACSKYVGEVHTRFWRRDLRAGNHLKDPGMDGRIIIKWIFRQQDWGA
jgi:hypothetical protein